MDRGKSPPLFLTDAKGDARRGRQGARSERQPTVKLTSSCRSRRGSRSSHPRSAARSPWKRTYLTWPRVNNRWTKALAICTSLVTNCAFFKDSDHPTTRDVPFYFSSSEVQPVARRAKEGEGKGQENSSFTYLDRFEGDGCARQTCQRASRNVPGYRRWLWRFIFSLIRIFHFMYILFHSCDVYIFNSICIKDIL